MFVDLDWPLNASSLLSASAELLVRFNEAWTQTLTVFVSDCNGDSDPHDDNWLFISQELIFWFSPWSWMYCSLLYSLSVIFQSMKDFIFFPSVVAPSGVLATDHLLPSISLLSCRLHLPPAVLESHCPHFWLQVSSPSVPWSPSSFVALYCLLQYLFCNAVILFCSLCPSQSRCIFCLVQYWLLVSFGS